MPRMVVIDPAHATGRAGELLNQVKSALGIAPNMLRMMANSPAVLEGYLALNDALSHGALDACTREAIALAVAEENECDYSLSAHSVFAMMAGLSEEEISSSRILTSADEKRYAALQFAAAILRARGAVDDAAFAAVRGAGFSDGEIAEIIAHVSLNILINYFNQAVQTVIDFPKVRAAAGDIRDPL